MWKTPNVEAKNFVHDCFPMGPEMPFGRIGVIFKDPTGKYEDYCELLRDPETGEVRDFSLKEYFDLRVKYGFDTSKETFKESFKNCYDQRVNRYVYEDLAALKPCA